MINNIIWFTILSLAGFFLYSVSGILTPFIASLIIAFFLNPLILKLEKIGIKRELTVGIIVGSFFLLIALLIIILSPMLFEQVQQFIHAIPKYDQYISHNFIKRIEKLLSTMNPQFVEEIRIQLSSFSNQFFHYILAIIKGLIHSGAAFLNIIGLILFTPILVFYLLKDWPLVEKNLRKLLPLSKKDVILEQLKQIDKLLSAYIRGQFFVCIILSIFYVISLSLLGLDYSLLIGMIAGFLAIIPYLGLIIGGIICIVVASLQFDQMHYIYLTLAIFLAGHSMEAYIISPKIIGDKIGLHPVWIIFSLMAAGILFGFWGMFFAIPIAAIIGVILRSLIKIYFASQLYHK